MFFDAGGWPEWLFILFALVVSLFMLILGVLMWRQAGATADAAAPAAPRQSPVAS